MKKKISIALVLIAVVALLVGCGESKTETSMKAALLTGGPVNDGGWNQLAYEGLKKLETGDFEIANTENVAQDSQKNAIKAYADQGFNLIIGHGYEWGDALVEAAKEYPDIKFIQIGGSRGTEAPNLTSAEFKGYELGYMVGKVGASLSSENKKLGFVGAAKIPTLTAEVVAIKAAVRETDPSIEVIDVYTGSWTDIAAGKKAAEQLINQGVDAIIGIGDACDAGVIQAIDEATAAGKKVWFIGWTGEFYPQFEKDFIATSGIQDVPTLIEKLGMEVKNNEFVAQAWLPSVSDNMLRLGTWSPTAPVEAKAAGEKAAEAIKSGEMNAQTIFALSGLLQSDFYGQTEILPSK